MKQTETKTDTTGFIKLSTAEILCFLYEIQGYVIQISNNPKREEEDHEITTT